MEGVFCLIDRDKDGLVTKEEVCLYFKSIGIDVALLWSQESGKERMCLDLNDFNMLTKDIEDQFPYTVEEVTKAFQFIQRPTQSGLQLTVDSLTKAVIRYSPKTVSPLQLRDALMQMPVDEKNRLQYIDFIQSISAYTLPSRLIDN